MNRILYLSDELRTARRGEKPHDNNSWQDQNNKKHPKRLDGYDIQYSWAFSDGQVDPVLQDALYGIDKKLDDNIKENPGDDYPDPFHSVESSGSWYVAAGLYLISTGQGFPAMSNHPFHSRRLVFARDNPRRYGDDLGLSAGSRWL
jgi:hypothetical protein